MKNILIIGGLDPSGLAGLAADIKTIAALGAHPAPVATTLTAQNTRSFDALLPADPAALARQLASVLDDLSIDAIKIGLLGSVAAVEVIRDAVLKRYAGNPPPIVLDPVLAASTKGMSADAEIIESMQRLLFPICTVVTPNSLEAAHLTGRCVENAEQARSAGLLLLEMGARAALIKGGHMQPPGTDYLVQASGMSVFDAAALDGKDTRGTGCALASAISVGLAGGSTIEDAVRRARTFIRVAIAAGRPLSTESHSAAAGPAGTSRHARAHGLHVIVETSTQAAPALRAGATTIQYRRKDATSTRAMLEDIKAIQSLGAQTIVNDRADLAFAAKADGVHLGAEDLDPQAARALLGPAPMIGATANRLEQAVAIYEQAGSAIDYLGVGPVFGTTSKKNPAPKLGLDALSRIVELIPRPIVAIGGICADNVAQVMQAGAAGVAVVSAIGAATDPEAATRRMLEEMNR